MISEQWIEALESGEYDQGKGKLYDMDTDSFCCLGVAGVVCNLVDDPDLLDQDEYLENDIAEEYVGITPNQQRFLGCLNDGELYSLGYESEGYFGIVPCPRFSFQEIAQLLREYNQNDS